MKCRHKALQAAFLLMQFIKLFIFSSILFLVYISMGYMTPDQKTDPISPWIKPGSDYGTISCIHVNILTLSRGVPVSFLI